jgi:hypothetical protein
VKLKWYQIIPTHLHSQNSQDYDKEKQNNYAERPGGRQQDREWNGLRSGVA